MRQTFFILLIQLVCFYVSAQEKSEPDFVWGNVSYFNVNCGESVYFNSVEIKVVSVENKYNTIKIGQDTVCVKVSKRSLPIYGRGVRLFVADNKCIKAIDNNYYKFTINYS